MVSVVTKSSDIIIIIIIIILMGAFIFIFLGLKALNFEACCQRALLNVQVTTLLFTLSLKALSAIGTLISSFATIYIYYTEVHLSFCNYMRDNLIL